MAVRDTAPLALTREQEVELIAIIISHLPEPDPEPNSDPTPTPSDEDTPETPEEPEEELEIPKTSSLTPEIITSLRDSLIAVPNTGRQNIIDAIRFKDFGLEEYNANDLFICLACIGILTVIAVYILYAETSTKRELAKARKENK